MLQRYRTQVAGALRDTAQFQVIKSPYDGEPVAEVGEADASDLELAIDAAHVAFESGAATMPRTNEPRCWSALRTPCMTSRLSWPSSSAARAASRSATRVRK